MNYNKKSLYSLFLILIFTTLTFSAWNVKKIGPCPTINSVEVEVGDARNDNINRVYVGTRAGGIYEWTYDSGQWSVTTVMTGIINLPSIVIGAVKEDGKNRIYVVDYNDAGALTEASWNGSSWDIVKIDSNFASLDIFIGEGRNDNKKRLYVGKGHPDDGLYEFSFSDSTNLWTKIQITTIGMEGNGCIGDVRNDGTNRIISNATVLDEFTWGNSSYSKTSSIETTDFWPDPTFLGKARNDQTNRIYANSQFGRVEYSYNNGTWEKNIFDATTQRGDIFVARLKNDGKFNIYSTFTAKTWGTPIPKGPLKEYSWNGTSYSESEVVDATTGATAMLSAGVGRNDDTVRIYTPLYGTGEIYEITNSSPYIESSAKIISTDKTLENKSLRILNVSSLSKNLLSLIYSTNKKENLNFELFNISGKLVYKNSFSSKGLIKKELSIPHIGSGLYFVKLSSSTNIETNKIIIK